MAFLEHSSKGASALAMFALLFLIAGIFFYGLNLLHKTFEHKFSKLFTFWSAFYFLAISFILSFQYVVQSMWAYDNNLPGSAIIFLSIFGVIGFLITIFGVISASGKGKISGKEILGLFGIAVVLIGLIFLTSISSNVMGTCYQKSCYDYSTQNSCGNAPNNLNCEWYLNNCVVKNCYNYREKSTCEDRNCKWESASNNCREFNCEDFKDMNLCKSHYIDKGCVVVFKTDSGARISSKGECPEYNSGQSCDEECIAVTRCDSSLANMDQVSCENNIPNTFVHKCYWDSTGSFCADNSSLINPSYKYNLPYEGSNYDTKINNDCNKYNNKKSDCFSKNECKWNPSIGYWSRAGDVPFSVWFVWIIINIFLVILILVIIGYGSIERDSSIINLGISFFILTIITRYIGFMMDLGGYTGLAIISIIGGISLIILGFLITWMTTKWRKKLIQETEKK